MKFEITLMLALAAALAGCEITMRDSDNQRTEAIEVSGEKGEEMSRGGRGDCSGNNNITTSITLDGQPADAMMVTAYCGDVKVGACSASNGIGRKDSTCRHTEPLNQTGRLGCSVTRVSGWPDFTASCTLH